MLFKLKIVSLIFSALIIYMTGYCQTASNLDLETGDFTGWTAGTGTCCPFNITGHGFDSLQHRITKGNGYDKHSQGMIPLVCPGGNYSALLGNDSIHAESEQLNYSLSVPNSPMLLAVRFAVVLENHSHPRVKQPRFSFELRRKNGELIDCGVEIIAGDSDVPYHTNGIIQYLPWSSALVDLRPYKGDSVMISFTTGDCEPGGHFGYAYIEASLIPAVIEHSFCDSSGSATLSVPPGFTTSWNTGDTTSTIQTLPGDYKQVYEATLTGNFGCPVSIELNALPFFPFASFSLTGGCDLNISFSNLSSGLTQATSFWEFGDSTTSSSSDPTHTFPETGIYDVTLTMTGTNNCMNSYTRQVIAGSDLEATISISDSCAGRNITFEAEANSSWSGQFSHHWNIGTFTTTEGSFSRYFSDAGTYPVLYVLTDERGCSDSIHHSLSIYDDPGCSEQAPLYIPNAFTPGNDGLNDTWVISYLVAPGSYSMKVYDRWGSVMFSTNDPDEGWSGMHGTGSYAPQGAYTYVCRFDDRIFSGTVLLIR
jgi:gliding motility-associated-like protein